MNEWMNEWKKKEWMKKKRMNEKKKNEWMPFIYPKKKFIHGNIPVYNL